MLEQKIEALTAAIEQLTRVIVDTQLAREETSSNGVSLQATQVATIEEPPVKTVVEATDKEISELPDREELKTKCAELVRANTANKEKIFNELGKYKAKKVLDLADSDLQAFSNFLKGLE